MTEPTAIAIRRQILDIDLYGTESAGLALQHRLPGVCAEVMLPALESALARFDPGDAHLRVEQLAIDVSNTSLERLEADLAEAVERQVVDYFLRNPPPRSTPARPHPPEGILQQTVAETVDEALVAFLRTGRLPWPFHVPWGARLEQLVLDSWSTVDTNPAPPSRTRALLIEVLALPSARARLIKQFTADFVMTVLRSLSPQMAVTLEQAMRAAEEIEAPSTARATFSRRIREAALLTASAGANTPSEPDELVATAWRLFDSGERDDPTIAKFVQRHWPGATKQNEPLPLSEDGEAPQQMTSSSEVVSDEVFDGILVANAGIVLLHPFLPRFFEGLGVVVSDELVDPDRAVCLLHCLATGESIAPEHQLTVAKALCAVPLDEPVEAEVGMTTSEVEETTALLQAAIAHWEALLNTSPDALRAEFLTRAGQLSLDDEGDWLLRVETRAVDILLDQLPWGISMVKMPWMTRLMRVEWR